MDDFYYFSGQSYTKVVTKNEDRYFVLNNQSGNVQYGKDKFTIANSRETVTLYKDWNNVDPTFKYIKFVEAFKDALPNSRLTDIKQILAYVIYQSKTGGFMDQKNHKLSATNTIWIMDDVAYNSNEAGNVVWGAVMRYFGIPEQNAKNFADYYTYITQGHPDEEWDQKAIHKGWGYYDEEFQKYYPTPYKENTYQ